MQTISRYLLACLAALAAAASVCLTGLLFYAWPTGVNDHALVLRPQTFARLDDLRREHKFHPDPQTMYPGAPSEQARVEAERLVDDLLVSVQESIYDEPRRSVLLEALKRELPRLDTLGPHEKDEALHYVERMLATVGVAGTEDLLSVWRYGVPFPAARLR